MLNWSVSLILLIVKKKQFAMWSAITVAFCNMLVQLFFDLAFGGKSALRLHGGAR